MNRETKVTKTDLEIDNSMVLDTCCESGCGISVMVEKDMKEAGRKTRCTACLMRLKLKK